MKSKAPLLLMEQMVMLLVFALAAALCLQAFALSDRLSRRSEARDKGVILSQTAAEVIRHQGGTAETALEKAAASLGGTYDPAAPELSLKGEGPLRVIAKPVPTGVPGLAKASLQVEWEGEVLFEMETAWQEVTS